MAPYQMYKIEKYMRHNSVLMAPDYDEWNFLYCLLRLLYPHQKEAAYSTLKKDHFHKFDLKGISAPLDLKGVSRLHKQNPWLNATFHFVHTEHSDGKTPYAKIGDGPNRYHFLFTRDKMEDDETIHFYFYAILKFDAFLTPKRGGRQQGKKNLSYYCYNCYDDIYATF